MFVGRAEELKKLDDAYKAGTFQMVVLYGRRRVGKTTLIGEFAHDKRTLFFTALEQSDADNLADFSRALAEFFHLPLGMRFETWRSAVDYLCEQAVQERFVFVFDEFPYAARRAPQLASVLQVAIDHRLKNTDAFVILCGSNQGFMESDVLGHNSPLYGRRTLQMHLSPLGYREAAQMTPWLAPDEAFRVYACVGGVPYYLAQVQEHASVLENLYSLYFDPAGFLYAEPELLLRQELSEPAAYNSVLRAVAGGATRAKDIAAQTHIERSSLPGYLSTLVGLGILERVVPFGENPARSKRALYRVREAMFDFWYCFVMPRASSVEAGLGEVAARSITDEMLATYLGHRFERVCAEWMVAQAQSGSLPIAVAEVGQWWGTDPMLRERVDIDVIGCDPVKRQLIVGECKYRNSFDETDAIRTLDHRSTLLAGYEVAARVIFSKLSLSEATRAKVSADDTLRSVTIEDLYAVR